MCPRADATAMYQEQTIRTKQKYARKLRAAYLPRAIEATRLQTAGTAFALQYWTGPSQRTCSARDASQACSRGRSGRPPSAPAPPRRRDPRLSTRHHTGPCPVLPAEGSATLGTAEPSRSPPSRPTSADWHLQQKHEKMSGNCFWRLWVIFYISCHFAKSKIHSLRRHSTVKWRCIEANSHYQNSIRDSDSDYALVSHNGWTNVACRTWPAFKSMSPWRWVRNGNYTKMKIF